MNETKSCANCKHYAYDSQKAHQVTCTKHGGMPAHSARAENGPCGQDAKHHEEHGKKE